MEEFKVNDDVLLKARIITVGDVNAVVRLDECYHCVPCDIVVCKKDILKDDFQKEE